MKVLITGVTGLIGSALRDALQLRGDDVTGVSRSAADGVITWGDLTPELMSDFDVVVNLAGESIAGRWTKAKKEKIMASRVDSTVSIAQLITESESPPTCLVQASAAGFYGSCGDYVLDEQSPVGKEFLAEVCERWEAAAAPVAEAGLRVVFPRFSIVLAKGPGALGRLSLLTRLCLGGPLGSGRQWWSWVSLEDTVRALLFLMDSEISGPVNVATDSPQQQKKFASVLGKVLRRPAFLPTPGIALRLGLGEMGKALLLDSMRLKPAVLSENGFEFKDAELQDTLERILKS